MLSGHEVYEDGTVNQISPKDTSYSNTKQLDYYKNQKVTTSSYAGAKKQYGDSDLYWWLRSSSYNKNDAVIYISSAGQWYSDSTFSPLGVSPAFRIG